MNNSYEENENRKTIEKTMACSNVSYSIYIYISNGPRQRLAKSGQASVEKAKKKGDHVLNAMSREVTPERNPVIERLLWRGRRGCSSETRLFQLREFLIHAARTVWIIQLFLVFFVFLFYSILSFLSFLSFFFLNANRILFLLWIRFL